MAENGRGNCYNVKDGEEGREERVDERAQN
jgi:hypothetical protein